MSVRALMLAGIASLAPCVAIAAPAQAVGVGQFLPPQDPVMISRTVVRSLVDGKEVRATRRYLVRFRNQPDGWLLEGQLHDVVVEAPPSLEMFAGVERDRIEPELFPIKLDRAGRMVVHPGPPLDDASRTRAVALGEMMIAGALVSANTRNQANAMLTQVMMAGSGGTAWPTDLFNPASPETLETRDIALPDGNRGSIKVRIRSDGAVGGTIPARVERTVQTELSGTRRTSQEIWTFERVK